MARFEMEGLERLIMDLGQLARFSAAAQDRMLDAGADVLTKAQRERAIDYDVWDPESSEHLADSIAKTDCKTGKDGRVIYVYPQGERVRGGITTRNAEIAFVNEFGRPGTDGSGRIAPRPFIRDANEDAAEEVEGAMYAVYDKEAEELGL